MTVESRSKGQFIVVTSSACQNYPGILRFSTAESCLDLPLQQKNIRKCIFSYILYYSAALRYLFSSNFHKGNTWNINILKANISNQCIPINSNGMETSRKYFRKCGLQYLISTLLEEGKQTVIAYMRERTTIKPPNDFPWVSCEHV